MYVVGVFTSFTLSQTGMVKHWFAEATQGPRGLPKGGELSIVINIDRCGDHRRRPAWW